MAYYEIYIDESGNFQDEEMSVIGCLIIRNNDIKRNAIEQIRLNIYEIHKNSFTGEYPGCFHATTIRDIRVIKDVFQEIQGKYSAGIIYVNKKSSAYIDTYKNALALFIKNLLLYSDLIENRQADRVHIVVAEKNGITKNEITALIAHALEETHAKLNVKVDVETLSHTHNPFLQIADFVTNSAYRQNDVINTINKTCQVFHTFRTNEINDVYTRCYKAFLMGNHTEAFELYLAFSLKLEDERNKASYNTYRNELFKIRDKIIQYGLENSEGDTLVEVVRNFTDTIRRYSKEERCYPVLEQFGEAIEKNLPHEKNSSLTHVILRLYRNLLIVSNHRSNVQRVDTIHTAVQKIIPSVRGSTGGNDDILDYVNSYTVILQNKFCFQEAIDYIEKIAHELTNQQKRDGVLTIVPHIQFDAGLNIKHRLLGKCYGAIGCNHAFLKRHDEANLYFEEALKNFEDQEDKDRISIYQGHVIIESNNTHNFNKIGGEAGQLSSLELAFQELKQGQLKGREYLINMLIKYFAYRTGESEKSDAVKVIEKHHDIIMSNTQHPWELIDKNIGCMYTELGNYDAAQKYFDKGIQTSSAKGEMTRNVIGVSIYLHKMLAKWKLLKFYPVDINDLRNACNKALSKPAMDTIIKKNEAGRYEGFFSDFLNSIFDANVPNTQAYLSGVLQKAIDQFTFLYK